MSAEPSDLEPAAGPSGTAARVAAAAAVYAALAVLWLALIPRLAPHSYLLGAPRYPDPLLNVAMLEWGYQSLAGGLARLFDVPMGYPLGAALATTENLIGWQLGYAPLRAAGIGPVPAYNAVLIAALAASGTGVLLLSRALGAGWAGGFVAGLVFALAPFHLSHAVHLQTLAIGCVPFALLALERFIQTGAARWAAAFAGLALLAVLSGLYIGTYLGVVAPLYCVAAWTVRRVPFRRRDAGVLALAGIAAVLAFVPVALPYLRFAAQHGFRHSAAEIAQFSTSIAALVTPGRTALWSAVAPEPAATPFPAFPGLIALLLAGAAWLQRGATRRTTAALAALAATALILSLGPRLVVSDPRASFGGLPLPGAALTVLPAVRFPVRMLLFGYLFGAVLAGLGVAALARRAAAPGRALLAAGAAALAVTVEYWPATAVRGERVAVPAPLAVSSAYAFLRAEREQRTDTGAVAEWPALRDRHPPALRSAWFVYGAVGHGRRVPAYLGNTRLAAAESLLAAAAQLPAESARRALRAAGVTRYVVHRRLPHADLVDSVAADRRIADLLAAGYPTVYRAGDATVFALDPPAAAAP